MGRHERVLLLALSIVALLVAASLSMIGTSAAVDDLAGAAPEGEVLTVHGEWSIRVLNELGRVEQEIEFSNDLTAAGARTLTALLTGAAQADHWSIRVAGSPRELCGSPPEVCRLGSDESALAADGPLAVRTDPSGTGFELAGEVEVFRDGSIDFVETHLSRCDVTSGECTQDNEFTSFTETGLDPVEVKAGQTVQVVVAISFD